MKMLLASNDVLALQAVAKRLVAFGIPIALQKPSDISSWLEIWIQRDGDFSLASKLVPTDDSQPAAEVSSARPSCSGTPQQIGADQGGVGGAASRIRRCLRRFRR